MIVFRSTKGEFILNKSEYYNLQPDTTGTYKTITVSYSVPFYSKINGLVGGSFTKIEFSAVTFYKAEVNYPYYIITYKYNNLLISIKFIYNSFTNAVSFISQTGEKQLNPTPVLIQTPTPN